MKNSISRISFRRAATVAGTIAATLAVTAAVAIAASPLGQQMLRLKSDLGKVQAAVASASTDAAVTARTVAAIADMQDAATQARALIPDTANTPELQAAYQNKIDELSDELKSLKNAVTAGDYAQAKDLLTRISQTKSEGHEQFNNG